MDDLEKQKISEQLTSAQNILVFVSEKSNFEGLAAGLALYLSLIKLNKKVQIVAKNPTVADAQMLYGVDKVGKQEDQKNLVVVIDKAVKNVDKVTYFLEGQKLKIVVHAFANSEGISQNDVEFETSALKPDMIISLGYETGEELRHDITREQQLDPNLPVLNLAKNALDKKIAHININNPQSSGIAEIIADFCQAFNFPLDEDISFNLYSGIAASTQMFSPTMTRESTLKTAAWLIKFGAGKASLAQSATQPPDTGQSQSMQPEQIQSSGQFEVAEIPIEQVEAERNQEKDWLKPPKIYHGSKSFDIES